MLTLQHGVFRVLQRISLQMTSTLDLGEVLGTITEGLVEELDAALARIWLLEEGDLCGRCYKRVHCPTQVQCLHLKASAGLYGLDPKDEYRRIPLGAFKIGQIAQENEPVCTTDVPNDPRIQHHDWAQQHGLISFAGYPLAFEDELLGVLGMFLRRPLQSEAFEVLGLFASQAAIAIKNASLFTEVNHLQKRFKAESAYLQEELKLENDFHKIVGSSSALKRALRKAEKVAPTDSTVLLQGETGTGKELLARAIHDLSPRSDRPLIKVNCGAIPAELVESELFGHEKGAFTGATHRREGRFELADGGTLFLDEVAELPLRTQVKLLRVLQEGEFERVGSSKTIPVDVRIIAATNRRLEDEMAAGHFRVDLYYRLSVFPIELPPLRERREDIPDLVTFFLESFGRKKGKELQGVTQESMERLKRYDWPGNVRELRNVLERAAILSSGPVIKIDEELGSPASSQDGSLENQTLEQIQREHILRVLEQTSWVINGPHGAARILDLHPNTLRSRMKKLGIQRPGEDAS